MKTKSSIKTLLVCLISFSATLKDKRAVCIGGQYLLHLFICYNVMHLYYALLTHSYNNMDMDAWLVIHLLLLVNIRVFSVEMHSRQWFRIAMTINECNDFLWHHYHEVCRIN